MTDVSITHIAELTSLSPTTVKRAEAVRGAAPVVAASAAALTEVFERLGVEFIPKDEHGGDGVRWRGTDPVETERPLTSKTRQGS